MLKENIDNFVVRESKVEANFTFSAIHKRLLHKTLWTRQEETWWENCDIGPSKLKSLNVLKINKIISVEKSMLKPKWLNCECCHLLNQLNEFFSSFGSTIDKHSQSLEKSLLVVEFNADVLSHFYQRFYVNTKF